MEWVSTAQAAEILSVAPRTLYQHREWMQHVTRRARNGRESPRGAGWLWSESDLREIKAIKQRCRLTFFEALRVFVDQRKTQDAPDS